MYMSERNVSYRIFFRYLNKLYIYIVPFKYNISYTFTSEMNEKKVFWQQLMLLHCINFKINYNKKNQLFNTICIFLFYVTINLLQ